MLEAASPPHWSTISNESAFGTDYFTRTAVVKSNIAADGSLTIYVQADAPSNPAQRTNWLPAPKVTLRSRVLAEGSRHRWFLDAAAGQGATVMSAVNPGCSRQHS